MAKPVKHPVLGSINLLGFGVNLERTPPRMRTAAPEQGEHNEEVLGQLGYTREQIQELAKAGVI
ncbi:MAG: hypothetical protein HY329_26055 [Chloroflexi bacterium]|nr:hypothetical protein [Chloroflexota bacterium]